MIEIIAISLKKIFVKRIKTLTKLIRVYICPVVAAIVFSVVAFDVISLKLKYQKRKWFWTP